MLPNVANKAAKRVWAEKFQLPLAGGPREQQAFKGLDARNFYLLEQVIRNQAISGLVITMCSVLVAVGTFMSMTERSRPSVGMALALEVIMAIFGLACWAGALRIREIVESAPEILRVNVVVPSPTTATAADTPPPPDDTTREKKE
jgi:hypothetical protein